MAFTPVSLPRLESTVCQPHTTTYLTEQQMQPFPTSSHSSTLSSPWLTVRDFSMSSAAEMLEFIYSGMDHCFVCPQSPNSARQETRISPVPLKVNLRHKPFIITAIFLPC